MPQLKQVKQNDGKKCHQREGWIRTFVNDAIWRERSGAELSTAPTAEPLASIFVTNHDAAVIPAKALSVVACSAAEPVKTRVADSLVPASVVSGGDCSGLNVFVLPCVAKGAMHVRGDVGVEFRGCLLL